MTGKYRKLGQFASFISFMASVILAMIMTRGCEWEGEAGIFIIVDSFYRWLELVIASFTFNWFTFQFN